MVEHIGAEDLTVWASPDGREWRRGEGTPGFFTGWLGGGNHRAAFWLTADRATREGATGPSYPTFLQADGTWCAVSPPAAGENLAFAAWNEDGSLVVIGSRERYGDPIIWQATGVRCDR